MSKTEFPKKKKERIAVIGGGISGLIIAYRLSQRGQKVTIFEKSSQLGGELSTINLTSGRPVERYYHHIFLNDKAVISLFNELEIEYTLKRHKSRVGVLDTGKVYPFSTASDLFKLPFLDFITKARLGVASFVIPRLSYKKFENITSKKLIIRYMGSSGWYKFWEPLFRLKFDSEANKISGAWFWARLKDRSSSRNNGELLLYPVGTFKVLIDGLEKRILEAGAEIKVKQKISQIVKKNNKFKSGNDFFDKIVCAMDLSSFVEIAPKELKELEAFREKKNQAVLVVLLETKNKISDYYWINVLDRSSPFGVIVEQTNLVPKEQYGINMVYLGRYLEKTDSIFRMSDEKVYELFINFLEKIFPGVKDEVINYYVFREQLAQPVIYPSYQTPQVKTSIENLYVFSSAHIYPQDRGLNNIISRIDRIVDDILYK